MYFSAVVSAEYTYIGVYLFLLIVALPFHTIIGAVKQALSPLFIKALEMD